MLEVVGDPECVRADGKSRVFYACRCDCGKVKRVGYYELVGQNKSCGCEKNAAIRDARTTHGGSQTRLYRTWRGMIARCENPGQDLRGDYGARGIAVCDEWRHDFRAFRDWATDHGYADDLTIERRRVDDGYCPGNCEWIPLEKQAFNTRRTRLVTAFGETKHFSEWCRDPRCKIGRNALAYRLNGGWEPEKAIATPRTK